jgi:hypothetical protein
MLAVARVAGRAISIDVGASNPMLRPVMESERLRDLDHSHDGTPFRPAHDGVARP